MLEGKRSKGSFEGEGGEGMDLEGLYLGSSPVSWDKGGGATGE